MRRDRVGLLLGALCSACASDVTLVIDRLWSADDPIMVIVADSKGLFRAEFVPPQAVQHVDISLLDDLDALYVRSFPFLHDYEPFATCEVTFGLPEGSPITPQGAWKSESIDALGARELEVEDDPRPFELRLLGCAQKRASCEVAVTLVSSPPTRVGLGAVIALPGGRAIAGGSSRSETDPRIVLLAVDEHGARELGPYDELLVNTAGFARRGERIIGAASDRLFELDLSGNLIRTSTLSFTVSRLASGADGSIGLISYDGRIGVIPADSAVVRSLEPPPYGASQGEIPKIALRSPDSLLVVGADQRLYLWEGGRWRQQLTLAETVDGVGADAVSFIATPTRSTIQRREDRGDWMPLGASMNLNGVTAAIPLDAGRYLFSGQSGQLLYWNGEAMCTPPSGTARNLETLSFEEGSRTAWAVGEPSAGDFTPPTILRLELPE